MLMVVLKIKEYNYFIYVFKRKKVYHLEWKQVGGKKIECPWNNDIPRTES